MGLDEPLLTRRMPRAAVVGLAVGIAFLLTYGTARLGWLPRGTDSWLGVALASVGTLVAHEGLHALTARAFGARPRFGLLWFGAFTTFDERLPRNRYLWTVLAPLVILDGLTLVLLAVWPAARGWAYLAFLVNTTGAAGDLWTAVALRHVPASASVEDTRAGFAVYGSRPSGLSEQGRLP